MTGLHRALSVARVVAAAAAARGHCALGHPSAAVRPARLTLLSPPPAAAVCGYPRSACACPPPLPGGVLFGVLPTLSFFSVSFSWGTALPCCGHGVVGASSRHS